MAVAFGLAGLVIASANPRHSISDFGCDKLTSGYYDSRNTDDALYVAGNAALYGAGVGGLILLLRKKR